MMRVAKYAVVAVFVLIAAFYGAATYLARFGDVQNITADDPNFERLPSHMQDTPIVAACTPPLYSYRWSEGQRGAAGEVVYTLRDAPQSFDAVTAQLQNEGCTVAAQDGDAWRGLTCGTYLTATVALTSEPGAEGCAELTVSYSGSGGG